LIRVRFHRSLWTTTGVFETPALSWIHFTPHREVSKMSTPRSERIAVLLARGVSRIRQREGSNWAKGENAAELQTLAPETNAAKSTTSKEEDDES
jgi:hypothetical protein